MDASFGCTSYGGTMDTTRIDRRSPLPGNINQQISMAKIGNRNGLHDTVNPNLL